MRKIDKIILHCSATKEGQSFTVKDIDSWHRQRGFKSVGYHYVVLLDGTIQEGRKESEIGAHCLNHNRNSIGICYIGGLDANGKAKDTRTDKQRTALNVLVKELKKRYPEAVVLGHRDCSPDKNGNGIIEKWEWLKECPCFDVGKEF